MKNGLRHSGLSFWIALTVLLLSESPAVAYDDKSPNWASWDHYWSLSRASVALLCMLIVTLVMFLRFFPARLTHERNYDQAPWPLNAFGQTLAWTVFLNSVVFLLFFAWLPYGGELLPGHLDLFPEALRLLDYAVSWGGLLVVAALVSFGVRLLFRHRESPRKPAMRG